MWSSDFVEDKKKRGKSPYVNSAVYKSLARTWLARIFFGLSIFRQKTKLLLNFYHYYLFDMPTSTITRDSRSVHGKGRTDPKRIAPCSGSKVKCIDKEPGKTDFSKYLDSKF